MPITDRSIEGVLEDGIAAGTLNVVHVDADRPAHHMEVGHADQAEGDVEAQTRGAHSRTAFQDDTRPDD